MINSCFYYYIVKQAEDQTKLLTATPIENSKAFHLELKDQEETETTQLWMLKTSDQSDGYYILNCSTGLVLEVAKDRTLNLHHIKHKQLQLFRFQCLSAQKMVFKISQYLHDSTIFFKDGYLVVQFTDHSISAAKWTLKRALKSTILANSYIFENESSGYVLDVNEYAEKEGSALQQNEWVGTFSQRWCLQKFKEFYFIKNLKSNLVATVKNKKSKEGVNIVQEKQYENNHRFQLWDIQERGYRQYEIRLASDRQLYFSTKLQDLSTGGEVVLMKYPNKLWRIIGQLKI